jgi:hypothetical protein
MEPPQIRRERLAVRRTRVGPNAVTQKQRIFSLGGLTFWQFLCYVAPTNGDMWQYHNVQVLPDSSPLSLAQRRSR